MADRSISPVLTVLAFIALVGLTFATVSLSFVPMGPAGHLAVGLAFGVTKAFIVALIFMHLLKSSSRTWLAAGVGLFWLGILISLTLSDYFTRMHAVF